MTMLPQVTSLAFGKIKLIFGQKWRDRLPTLCS